LDRACDRGDLPPAHGGLGRRPRARRRGVDPEGAGIPPGPARWIHPRPRIELDVHRPRVLGGARGEGLALPAPDQLQLTRRGWRVDRARQRPGEDAPAPLRESEPRTRRRVLRGTLQRSLEEIEALPGDDLHPAAVAELEQTGPEVTWRGDGADRPPGV